ncbi:MAG: deaminase [Balneolaceae bacterium]
MLKPDLSIMQLAIDKASQKKTPFAAAIASGDQVYATAVHPISSLNDTASHAEKKVLEELGSLIHITEYSGFSLYSTCEPCPACLNTAKQSKVNAIFFGCSREFLSRFLDQNRFEYSFPSSPTIVTQGGVLEEPCKELVKKLLH